jgi:hypothetical protein
MSRCYNLKIDMTQRNFGFADFEGGNVMGSPMQREEEMSMVEPAAEIVRRMTTTHRGG